MKKTLKVLLVIFLALVLAAGIFALYQRNNILAVTKSLTLSKEEIAKQLDESRKKLSQDLEKNSITVVSDFTSEEEQMILNGEITLEEAVASLNKKNEENKKNQQAAETTNTSDGQNKIKVDELISDKIIELYSLKAYYLGQLGQLEASVKKDYRALSEEKKNLIGKQEIVSKYIGTATALLNQCDKEVAGLLTQLEKEIKKLKGDTSIINTIKNAYENEKALKKAYYIKLMEG